MFSCLLATVYGDLPKASAKLRERRMITSGDYDRYKEEIIQKGLFREPKHGMSGSRNKTFVQLIKEDTGLNGSAVADPVINLRVCMFHRSRLYLFTVRVWHGSSMGDRGVSTLERQRNQNVPHWCKCTNRELN